MHLSDTHARVPVKYVSRIVFIPFVHNALDRRCQKKKHKTLKRLYYVLTLGRAEINLCQPKRYSLVYVYVCICGYICRFLLSLFTHIFVISPPAQRSLDRFIHTAIAIAVSIAPIIIVERAVSLLKLYYNPKIDKMQQNSSEKKQRTIIVEGNIGAGKSTFLNHMARYVNVQVLPEPLEKWTNLNGNNLLDLMYANTEKWSYTFQNYALLTQLERATIVSTRDIKIMERSIYSARYCFADALLMNGKIEKVSHQVFVKWFEYVEKCVRDEIDLIVYVRVMPELAYDRIDKRNRVEEKTVPFEYIRLLHDLHERWLFGSNNNNNNNQTVASNGIPVFVLDANLPPHTIHTEYERFEEFLLKSSQFNIHLKEN